MNGNNESIPKIINNPAIDSIWIALSVSSECWHFPV
jgi:hypothetical protein